LKSRNTSKEIQIREEYMRVRWQVISRCIFAVVIVSLGVLSAQESVTIKIWSNMVSQAPSLEKEFALFMAENPDINIEYTPLVGAEYNQQIALAFRSGNSPDIFGTVVGESPEDFRNAVLDGKWATPLNAWATPEWQSQFPKGAFAEGVNMFDGQIYSAPWGGNAECCFFMFINVQAFKDAGLVDAQGEVLVPTTWAQQREYAQKILETSGGKMYGIGFGAKQGEFALSAPASGIALSGINCDYYSRCFDWQSGSYERTSAPWIEWMNHWIDMKDDGTLYPQSGAIDDEQARVLFGEGEFAMYYGGVWSPGSWASTNPDFEENVDYIAVMPPTLTGNLDSFVHVGGADTAFAISSQSKNQEAAWRVFEFMHSLDSAKRWASYGEGLRVYPETAQSMSGVAADLAQLGIDKVKVSPNFASLRPQVGLVKEDAVPKNHAYYVLSAFNGQLTKEDVPAAMAQLEQDLNAELDRAIEAAKAGGTEITREDFTFPDWTPGIAQTTEELRALLGE
jgi:ABC-type glycerol-3-phosphate transport system substrate-binding protein